MKYDVTAKGSDGERIRLGKNLTKGEVEIKARKLREVWEYKGVRIEPHDLGRKADIASLGK